MNGRITHFHNHYHVVGNYRYDGILADRLDRIAAETLPDALAHTLHRAFNDDQTVYILRQVKARLALTMNQLSSERPIARQWAGCLTQSVVRTISRSGQEGTDWVRFDNQAAYVAQFITDIVNGRAKQHWFYFPLAAYLEADSQAAIGQILLDNREWLAQILNHLRRQNVLDSILDQLDDDTLRAIWSQEPQTPASLQPLFIRTVQLVETLQFWQTAQPVSTATLFDRYLASRPPPADWQDRRSLAIAVLNILRHLADRGYLNLSRLTETLFRQRLEKLLLEWDWLDAEWLMQILPEQLHLSYHKPPENTLPLRTADLRPTPRQKMLLDDLLAAMTTTSQQLDPRRPDSPANALRLYTLLTAHAPRWSEESLAEDIIQRLLHTWGWLLKGDAPSQALAQLRSGEIVDLVRALPPDDQAQATHAFRQVTYLGAEAIAILQHLGPLNEQAAQVAPEKAAASVETACAGIFLLLRPVLDVQLPWLVQQSNILSDGELSPLSAFLLTLAVRWADAAGLTEEQADAGICRLAGLDESPAWGALQAQWAACTPAAHSRFQVALLQTLAGLRLFNPDTLFLYQMNLSDTGSTLVAGDDSGRLWLLGQEQPETVITATVQSWREQWQAATGVIPTIVADESLLPALVGLPDLLPPTDSTYLQGKEALAAAFHTLAPGRLDSPQADLTVGLTAVSLLRLWARWLRQFTDSSISYLLTNMIHRAGRLLINDEAIVVKMENRSLDMVLDMAGYFDELERVSWLSPPRLRFKRRGSP